MKCDMAHESIALAVYGELVDEQSHQLEQHLAGCESCRSELEAAQALFKAMSLHPVEEPSANLVARARVRLEETLDTLPRGSWLLRAAQQFSNGFHRLSSAPIAASTLAVMALTAGGYGGYRAGTHSHDAAQASLILQAAKANGGTARIANVSSIVQDPNSETVEVQYNRLVPDSIHGSLNDPQIRQLLLLGAQNRVNSDVHDNSVGLLADECHAGRECSDGPVRNALMVALLYDKSPNVRLKALRGLQPYIADDMRVRDAVLESLMNDSDARVRTQAIGLLEPVQADTSVREVLHTIAARDNNAQIRTVSQQVLDQIPQIQ